MPRAHLIVSAAAFLAALSGPAFADGPKPSCTEALKTVQAAKDLADLKLGEEYERSDAQVYLIRLELSVTKKRLADALARCGAACAPPAH